jgi:hypothetical protein
VGIFDSSEEHPPDKIRRYVITGIVFVALLVLFAMYLLRFHKEIRTAKHFMDAVESENLEQAFNMWGRSESFSYKDFQEDWGPNGYYGPVKSYHIEGAEEIKRGSETPSGTVVTVEVSPFTPFPSNHDALKQSKTKEVRIWVEYKDQSLSYPP